MVRLFLALLETAELSSKVDALFYIPTNHRIYGSNFSMYLPALTIFFFFFNKFIYLFIYLFFYLFWLCWVFVSVQGLSLVAASGGHSSSRCAGLSLSWPLLLQSTGSRRTGSVVVAHGPSCPAACGIFPDQGSNPCPLHWQADSQPLRHQGSPLSLIIAILLSMKCYLIVDFFNFPDDLWQWASFHVLFLSFLKFLLTAQKMPDFLT